MSELFHKLVISVDIASLKRDREYFDSLDQSILDKCLFIAAINDHLELTKYLLSTYLYSTETIMKLMKIYYLSKREQSDKDILLLLEESMGSDYVLI